MQDLGDKKKAGKGKLPHAEFAHRLQLACEDNPHCPPPNYGRLSWFVDRFAEFNKSVTTETVRRWLAGEARPRTDKMTLLAKILKTDEAWLSVGGPKVDPKERRRAHSREASGPVNLVAGAMQVAGSTPAFPDDENGDPGVNLQAVIRGAFYRLHVTMGAIKDSELRFNVQADALKEDILVIGVVVREGLMIEFYEVEPEVLREAKPHAGVVRVSVPDDAEHPGLRRITDFSVRL